MLVIGLVFGLGIQVLGLGLGLESGPWPWPWPRLRRSRPRCYHALHLRHVFRGWNLCSLDTCLKEFCLFLPAQPLLRGFISNSGLIISPHRAKMSDKLLESLVFAKYVVMGNVRAVAWLIL